MDIKDSALFPNMEQEGSCVSMCPTPAGTPLNDQRCEYFTQPVREQAHNRELTRVVGKRLHCFSFIPGLGNSVLVKDQTTVSDYISSQWIVVYLNQGWQLWQAHRSIFSFIFLFFLFEEAGAKMQLGEEFPTDYAQEQFASCWIHLKNTCLAWTTAWPWNLETLICNFSFRNSTQDLGAQLWGRWMIINSFLRKRGPHNLFLMFFLFSFSFFLSSSSLI